jgi:glycosyltransferase involved in cell wall biosynthesis
MNQYVGNSDYVVVLSETSGRLSGVDVFSRGLARGLEAEGVPAHIILTEHDRRVRDHFPQPADVAVAKLGVSRGMRWRRRCEVLGAYLEQCAPCIYVPNYDWNHSCISPVLSSRVGIVGIVHSDDPWHYEHVTRLGRYWNAVVAVSSFIADRVAALDSALRSRLVTIPYGVELPQELPSRPEGRPYLAVAYAGRLVQEQKRVLDLPRIVAAATERGVPVRLTVIGGGRDEKRLRRACARFVADGQVDFTGIVPNERVLDVFDESDAVILTSEFEGLPVSLLEAMSRGCVPIVAETPSGIPELVQDGVNGYRLPVGDVSAFSARLELLHESPMLRRQLSRNAFDTVRRGGYGLDDMVCRYASLFRQVLEDARSGRYRRPPGKLSRPPARTGVSFLKRWLPESLWWLTDRPRKVLLEGYRRPRRISRREGGAAPT